jgi:hypothetical protein
MAPLDGVDVLYNSTIPFTAVRKQNSSAQTIIDFPCIGTSIQNLTPLDRCPAGFAYLTRLPSNTPSYQYSGAGPFDQWPSGMGFDYFYGFMGGETDQWTPKLLRKVNRHLVLTTPTFPRSCLDWTRVFCVFLLWKRQFPLRKSG